MAEATGVVPLSEDSTGKGAPWLGRAETCPLWMGWCGTPWAQGLLCPPCYSPSMRDIPAFDVLQGVHTKRRGFRLSVPGLQEPVTLHSLPPHLNQPPASTPEWSPIFPAWPIRT